MTKNSLLIMHASASARVCSDVIQQWCNLASHEEGRYNQFISILELKIQEESERGLKARMHVWWLYGGYSPALRAVAASYPSELSAGKCDDSIRSNKVKCMSVLT